MKQYRLTRYIIVAAAALSLSLTANSKVEDFVVYDVQGNRHTFCEIMSCIPEGGMLIINFTSVTCKPCRKEIPELLRIEKKSSGRVKLICLYAECCDPVEESASSLGIFDKAFVDPFGKIRGMFDVRSFPVTFIVDKKYTVLGRYDGYTEANIGAIREVVR